MYENRTYLEICFASFPESVHYYFSPRSYLLQNTFISLRGTIGCKKHLFLPMRQSFMMGFRSCSTRRFPFRYTCEGDPWPFSCSTRGTNIPHSVSNIVHPFSLEEMDHLTFTYTYNPLSALHCSLPSRELIPSSRYLSHVDDVEDPFCSSRFWFPPRGAGSFRELLPSSKVSDFELPFILKVPLSLFMRRPWFRCLNSLLETCPEVLKFPP